MKFEPNSTNKQTNFVNQWQRQKVQHSQREQPPQENAHPKKSLWEVPETKEDLGT